MSANQDKIENILLNSENNMVLMLRDFCTGLFASETETDLKKTEREMSKRHLLYLLMEAKVLKDCFQNLKVQTESPKIEPPQMNYAY